MEREGDRKKRKKERERRKGKEGGDRISYHRLKGHTHNKAFTSPCSNNLARDGSERVTSAIDRFTTTKSVQF